MKMNLLYVFRKGFFIGLSLMAVSICQAFSLTDSDWAPVSQEELKMTAPTVDPDACAEILYKEVKVNDRLTINSGAEAKYYKRIKIFNQRGVEWLTSCPIVVDHDMAVTGLEVRVTQTDGTVVTLNPKDVFVRDVVRNGDDRIKLYSFSVPGLKVGAIVEYKWCEQLALYMLACNKFFGLADEFPVRLSKFKYRPYNEWIFYFNTNKVQGDIKKGSNGYWEAEVHNIPALPDEPNLPAKFSYQPWVILRYTGNEHNAKVEDFWKELCKNVYAFATSETKSGDDAIEKKAAELTQGISDPRERLKKLYDFCTHEIANSGEDKRPLILDVNEKAERDKLSTRLNVSDTFTKRCGDESNIDALFAALANAAGFDARLAFCANRSDLDWDINIINIRMLPDTAIAVKIGDQWELFQPGMQFLPFGMLRPENEQTVALVGEWKKAELVPIYAHESSATKELRKGEFVVREDGTLEGKVTMRLGGYKAFDIKREMKKRSSEERIEKYKDKVRTLIPAAELSDITFTNIDDPDKDVEVTYDVVVPGYADVTDQRIFIEPNYFEKGRKPVFQKEKRDYDVRFNYAWETHNDIKIKYPANYVVEEGAAPHSLSNTNQFVYIVKLGISPKSSQIVYSLDFKINILDIPVKVYPGLKQYFDAMDRENHHVLTLCMADENAAGNQTPASETTKKE